MRLSERISSYRHIAMTLLIIAASLEYSLVHTSYHGVLKIVKVASALVLAWAFYQDQRAVFSSWQMKLSRQMLLHVAVLILALLGFQASTSVIEVLVRETNAYGPERTEQLEIGILMAAYPLLILLLGLFTQGYIPWLRRNAKHMTLLLYLFLWIWCGAFYFYMAERTKGSDFIFSDEAKIQMTLKGISTDERYDDYDEYRLQEIFKKGQYKKDYIKMADDEFLTTDATGIDWGEIYENMLGREGYAYFSFGTSPEPLTIKPKLLDYDALAAWEPYLGKTFQVVDVRLYKSKDGRTGNNEVVYVPANEGAEAGQTQLGEPDETMKLYFAGQDYEHFMQVFDGDRKDRHLSRLIAASHTLPDGKFLELYVGINGYASYHIEDFWYFSAITITTLGFGDITPNSGPVKAAVTFETLLGVMLIGIYVSGVRTKKPGSKKPGS